MPHRNTGNIQKVVGLILKKYKALVNVVLVFKEVNLGWGQRADLRGPNWTLLGKAIFNSIYLT